MERYGRTPTPTLSVLMIDYWRGPLAQLVAHLHDAQGVRGSSPLRPTTEMLVTVGKYQAGVSKKVK